MESTEGRRLVAYIAQQIEEQLGLEVAVEEVDGIIVLSGVVDSPEASEAAERLAATLAPGKTIENDLDLTPEPPVEIEEEIELHPDFVGGRFRVMGDMEEEQPWRALERAGGTAEPFFPPTDPVVRAGPRGDVEVVGGFSATSMDSLEVEPSATDELLGDEAIAEAVRRELREDAATTDLQIEVSVLRGVVRLRGTVPSIEDAINAEEVASRVPGVVEVREELEIASL